MAALGTAVALIAAVMAVAMIWSREVPRKNTPLENEDD